MFLCVIFFAFWANTGLGEFDLPDVKTKPPGSSREKSKNPKSESMSVVGQEIKLFGEEVARGVDRVTKKKAFELGGDPWLFQGIPLIFPGGGSGFNVGFKVLLQNIQRQDPHKAEYEAQVLSSDKGRYKHALRVDFPHALGGDYRIMARLAYDRDIVLRYYGIGNQTTVDEDALENNNPLYQNIRGGPSFTLDFLRYLGHNVRLGPVLGLKWTSVHAPAGSLLLAERPTGVDGGATHHVGFAIVHDTLDFEPYPSKGSLHELYTLYYGPVTGSRYEFVRSTYTYRTYFLLSRNLILAHRTLFEALGGDVPYYELGAVGGSFPSVGLGNDRFFRGYDSNRFLDNLRLAMGFELRWDPFFFEFYNQGITIGFVPWIDIGRVWSKFFPLDFSRLHVSSGSGMRLIWNSRFVVRLDYAVTSEGTAGILEIGNSF